MGKILFLMENKNKVVKKIYNQEKRIFIFLLIVGISMYFENGYFNIISAKKKYFLFITIIDLFLFSILFLLYVLLDGEINVKLNLIDFGVILFLFNIVIGTAISEDYYITLFGKNGWGLGTYFVSLCILVYFQMSLFKTSIEYTVKVILLVSIIVMLLGSINMLGIDPLGMLSNLQSGDKGKYISTIGNINWYGEYCSIIVTLSTVLIINSEENYNKAILWLSFFLSFFSCIICTSDTGMVGVAVSFIYTFLWGFKSGEIKKSGKIIIVIAGILLIIRILYSYKCLYYSPEELQFFLVNKYNIIILIILGILEMVDKFGKAIKYILPIGLIMIMCLKLDINLINKYFIFDDSWGTNRGYIWRYTLKIYNGFSWKNKIWGNGLDNFGTVVQKMYKNELYIHFGKKLVNAHSQILQLLITTGLNGLTIYYSEIVYILYQSIKMGKKECIAVIVSILTYCIQGIFNNFQPVGIVLFTVLVSSVNSCIKYGGC